MEMKAVIVLIRLHTTGNHQKLSKRLSLVARRVLQHGRPSMTRGKHTSAGFRRSICPRSLAPAGNSTTAPATESVSKGWRGRTTSITEPSYQRGAHIGR